MTENKKRTGGEEELEEREKRGKKGDEREEKRTRLEMEKGIRTGRGGGEKGEGWRKEGGRGWEGVD